jgi:hypothetical protein
MIFDRAMTVWAQCFPSWRCRYWRSWTSGFVLVVFVLLLLGFDHCSMIFFLLCNSSSFLVMCIRIAARHYVGAEARCNCISAILIYTLYRKKNKQP